MGVRSKPEMNDDNGENLKGFQMKQTREECALLWSWFPRFHIHEFSSLATSPCLVLLVLPILLEGLLAQELELA